MDALLFRWSEPPMHFLDHFAPCGGNDELYAIAGARERANGRGGKVTRNIQGVSLAKILEANREHEREITFARSQRELTHCCVVRPESPLGRIRTNRRRASIDRGIQLVLPARPIRTHHGHGPQRARVRCDKRKELTVTGRRIAIEGGGKMTYPRLGETLALEHADERRWLGMRHVSEWIAADKRIDVDHER